MIGRYKLNAPSDIRYLHNNYPKRAIKFFTAHGKRDDL
jgi:hypothetical protein